MSYFLQTADGVERVPAHECPHCRKGITALERIGPSSVAVRHEDGSNCEVTPGLARKLAVQKAG